VVKIVKLGSILLTYCLVAGVLLALVHIKTAPVIEANKASSGEAVMVEILPGMDGGFVQQGEETAFPYWIGYSKPGKRNPGGYIFIALGKGYSSTIETMVGVDINNVITGVKVLFQQETPGMGDKIEEVSPGENDPWFTRQFIGKSVNNTITLAADGGGIDAISGATISSLAVTESIASGLRNLKDALAGKTFPQRTPQPEPEENLMEQLMRQTEEEK